METNLVDYDLIKENNNLIYSICSKYSSYNDKEDLYQVGAIGLINAYKNFDASKNVKFSTYAYFYIIGEINKYVRENKSIKASKDLLRLGIKIKEYINKHLQVRGYEPSTLQIADMLQIDENKVISALEICKFTKSLDEEIISDGKPLSLLDVTPSSETISKDELLDLKEAFKYLSVEEKELVINRYFKDLTQSEVAQIFGVNQVYVSRLEKKALTKMKQRMVS